MSDPIIEALKRIPGVIDATLHIRADKIGISKYRVTTVEPYDDSAVSDLTVMMCDVHPKVWGVTLRMVRNGRMYHELTVKWDNVQLSMDVRY